MLRDAAAQRVPVVFSNHASKQMRQRKINRHQVLRCLGGGGIVEGPAQDVRGRWSCRVEGVAEGRGIAVAVGFELPRIVVITAFWTT